MPGKIVVIGLGEVGRPLHTLIAEHFDTVGIDLTPPASPVGKIDILHICYPYSIGDFRAETARYLRLYKPELTIINSTVAVGTTREIAELTGSAVVHSPVRGKHVRMAEDLRFYTKFIGATDSAAAQCAAEHFQSVGLKTKVLSSPEATELAKLTETTYFGVLIAWAQEVERLCELVGQSYDEVTSFYEDVGFFPPVKYFPGVIGGHCVMPNLNILRQLSPGIMLECIELSNRAKKNRESAEQLAASGTGLFR